MEFEFVLPRKNEDLLETTGSAYCVTRVFNNKECSEKLRHARLELSQNGFKYIFDHFDVFYSIIETAKTVQTQTIFRAMEILFESIDKIGKLLADFLQQTNPAHRERCEMLNALKMLLYAQITLVKCVDKEVFVSEGKKTKKQSPEEAETTKWENHRYKALLQLFNVLQLPLSNLWDPPVPEEPFVNLCADFAYRTIEHLTIKKKDVEDTSFQILGTLLKSYNHSIVFPVKIFELMKSSEMSAAAIANGVVILYEQYSIQTILKVVIDQIFSGLDNDVSDGPTVKNISTFFTELGNTAPTLVMPFIREIASDVLSLESYQLRICILQLMSEIVMSELTGEELTQDQKDTRDEYLEHIYDHIHDVNAHVRSKTLALWSHMKRDNAVPLIWLSPVVRFAVGRLEDKSNLVRRNAIQLIKSFLERNPFAAKLSIEELEKRYEEKLKELSDFREKIAEESNKVEEVNENFDEILPEMKPYIVSCIQQKSIEDERIRPEDCENLYAQFPTMIEEKQYERIVLLTRKAEEMNGNWAVIEKMDSDTAKVYFAMLLKSYFLLQNNCKNYQADYKKTENAVRFLEDSLEFSRLIVSAVPKLQELLMSKAESDVNEAIDFFTSAYRFGIKNTESGMRQLLFLVWSVSKDKRGPVRDAYKCVLFSTDLNGRAHAVKAVFNLLRFIENLSFSQFVAFEELVKEFVLSDDIDNNMITVMFEIYTKKLDNVTNNDSRLALKLLVICSNVKPSIARANAALLEQLCFENGYGLKDSRVFTLTLDFLMNVHADREGELYQRLETDDLKVSCLTVMFRKYFMNNKSACFDEVCTKTFQYIYKMCHLPNVICQDVLKDIWDELLKISGELEEGAVNDDKDDDGVVISQAPTQRFSQDSQSANTILNIPVTLAARFIFMVGYLALKELIYLDVDVFSNLKYRHDLTELQKNKNKNPTAARLSSSVNISASAAAKRRSCMPPTPGGPGEEENHEEDLVGQSNDDVLIEQISVLCEKEMLFHKESIFKRFTPLILEFLKYPAKYNYPELQRSAVLTLIHFMSISADFCETNMPFLMNIFSHTQDVDIKCNIIIGLSDMTFRYANVVQPWSGHLYSTLHDENREVRLTSVRILAHIISHEMLRVKGQISDIALCLVDRDDEIRKTTEIFFKEIAHKDDILYNVLPDIISRLGDPNLKLEEGKYQIIMKYIMGLINKGRQIEGLVEKLCYRFNITYQERQWRDISFCLSLLTYTEKMIKKLIDSISHFKDKVQVQEVYDYFKQIITNTSKSAFAKPELKAIVQDFQLKLDDCLAVNDNPNVQNEDGQASAPRRINVPVKRPGRGKSAAKKQPTRGRARKPVTSSDENSDSETENQPPTRQKGRKVERRIIESDSDEEIPTTTRFKPPARASRSKVVQETSSDDSPQKAAKPSAKRGKR